jgi:hypothetical protein
VLNIHCPHCKETHSIDEGDMGAEAECYACGKEFTISSACVVVNDKCESVTRAGSRAYYIGIFKVCLLILFPAFNYYIYILVHKGVTINEKIAVLVVLGFVGCFELVTGLISILIGKSLKNNQENKVNLRLGALFILYLISLIFHLAFVKNFFLAGLNIYVLYVLIKANSGYKKFQKIKLAS